MYIYVLLFGPERGNEKFEWRKCTVEASGKSYRPIGYCGDTAAASVKHVSDRHLTMSGRAGKTYLLFSVSRNTREIHFADADQEATLELSWAAEKSPESAERER
jgi:hypothetical protein